MKRSPIRAMLTAAAVAAAAVLVAPAAQGAPAPGDVTWNGAADKAVAVGVDATQNTTRKDASGPKIASNAHSADFPGIYFVWDSKQKDSGYLKVSGSVFQQYDSFTLTAKESSTYWDFVIAPQPDQATTDDGSYVFYIPKAASNKNINMVFVGGWVEKTAPPAEDSNEVNVGFIGCYVNGGTVMTTSFYWQNLAKDGDQIDWAAVDAAYAQWEAQGGLARNTDGWLSSGPASKHFAENEPLSYGDLGAGQLESYYNTWYLDPGCDTSVVVSYDRYRAYVQLWNDLYLDPTVSAADKAILHDDGGIDHYNALLVRYGAESLPPYYHFSSADKAVYDQWADALEVGLKLVYTGDLEAYVQAYQLTDD